MRAATGNLLLCLGLCLGCARAQIATSSVVLRSFDGRTTSAELGRMTVPADRRHPGRLVSLSFYRLPARNPGNSVPILFLMGGPGVAATFIAQVPPYFDLFRRMAERSPVILLDQRGTGQSTPAVDCPPGFQPPPDLFATPRKLLKTYADAYAACAVYWSARGALPDDYAVEEAADDVEDLRAALGIPEVDLLALSFGTRIGLEVIRRHPKSVHRAVFQGTVTPDGLVRFPVELDAFFRRTASDAQPQARAKGLVDDLESALRSAIKRLEHKPLSVPIETKKGNRLTVTIGPSMFRALVATRTADPNLPALLTSVARGETSVVALILQSIYRDLEGGAGSMMAHSMPCTATDGSHRLKFAGAQAPPSLVGEPFDNAVVSDAFCRQIHSYRRTRSTPIPSGDMPVLFIGGDLDDRTPVALAEAALRGFAHGRLVVAANGGHELLVDGQVQELVARFFAGDEDPQTRISLPPRTFSTVTEAAQPPRRPR